jgi:KAP family P-loop domain
MIAAAIWRISNYYSRQLPAIKQKLDKYQLNNADDRLSKAKAAADEAIVQSAIHAAAQLINEAQAPFYQDRLFVYRSPTEKPPDGYRRTVGLGLSEVLSPANEVATETRSKVVQLLETLPGGSIGIAGPRGVGKSTLLLSLCSTHPRIKQDTAIAVYTTAPVEYEHRDFLLHIYASVCRTVLRSKNASDDRNFKDINNSANEILPEFIKNQQVAGIFLVIVRGLLFAVGMSLAIMMIDHVTPAEPDHVAAGTSHQTPTALPAQTTTVNPDRTTTTPATPNKVTPDSRSIRSMGTSLLKVLDFKPGAIVQWGIIAFLVGTVLVVFESVHKRREALIRKLALFFPMLRRPAREPPPQDDVDGLIGKSRAALRDIRFQRSYSSGWSGSLRLPTAFDATTNQALSLAQKQQSLPDLVEEFKNFVRDVTVYYPVIIGIDELDKISSDEKAQAFINEIKAMFNIPRCFYLISVSESAISNFERRGLAFRDAFDSAFDDILQVRYLTQLGSRGLLGRRVINLPLPFLALCHLLSAGLPRDLIRITRSMLDHAADNPNENSLREVGLALIQTELRNKLHAIALAAREIPMEPEVTNFLTRVIQLLSTNILSPKISIEYAKSEQLPPATQESDEEKKSRAKLDKLGLELDSFLYFCVTAAELFNSIRDEETWERLDSELVINELAEARQGLELSSGVAVFRLDQLLRKWGLASRFGSVGAEQYVPESGKPPLISRPSASTLC